MLSNGADAGVEGAAESYDAIERAVKESKRGRWFLAEHARRLQSGETSSVLDALKRLEAAVGEFSQPHHTPEAAGQLQATARQLQARSEAIQKIAGELDDADVRRRLSNEADTLRLLALSHDLYRQRYAALEPPVNPDHLKFFAGDADLFEDPPFALSMEPAPSAEAAPVKNRIVIIRHAPGDEPAIPLQGELSATG